MRASANMCFTAIGIFALFFSGVARAGKYDEAFTPEGHLRGPYIRANGLLKKDLLSPSRQERVALTRSPLGDKIKIFPVPLVLGQTEANYIRSGVHGVLSTLHEFFTDVAIGDQSAIKEGIVPMSVIQAILADTIWKDYPKSGTNPLENLRAFWEGKTYRNVSFVMGPDIARDSESGQWRIEEINVGPIGGTGDTPSIQNEFFSKLNLTEHPLLFANAKEDFRSFIANFEWEIRFGLNSGEFRAPRKMVNVRGEQVPFWLALVRNAGRPDNYHLGNFELADLEYTREAKLLLELATQYSLAKETEDSNEKEKFIQSIILRAPELFHSPESIRKNLLIEEELHAHNIDLAGALNQVGGVMNFDFPADPKNKENLRRIFRKGHKLFLNAPGTDELLSSKLLLPYLNALSVFYFGEDLNLPVQESRVVRVDEVLRMSNEELKSWVLKSPDGARGEEVEIFPRMSDDDGKKEFIKIRRKLGREKADSLVILQKFMEHSTLKGRYIDIRPLAFAFGDSAFVNRVSWGRAAEPSLNHGKNNVTRGGKAQGAYELVVLVPPRDTEAYLSMLRKGFQACSDAVDGDESF